MFLLHYIIFIMMSLVLLRCKMSYVFLSIFSIQKVFRKLCALLITWKCTVTIKNIFSWCHRIIFQSFIIVVSSLYAETCLILALFNIMTSPPGCLIQQQENWRSWVWIPDGEFPCDGLITDMVYDVTLSAVSHITVILSSISWKPRNVLKWTDRRWYNPK